MDAEVPGAMQRLRHEITAYLARHADDTASLDEAEVIVSEALGNAVRHAGGPVWVSLTWPQTHPRLTVRDLGPGFDPALIEAARHPRVPELDADGDPLESLESLNESGRGFFLITQLSPEVRAGTREEGGYLSVLLPLWRRPTRDLDRPRNTVNPLPALEEAREEGGFGKEAFLRALVVQLARTVDYEHGPDAAETVVAQVGADVGGQMEREFRLAEHVVGAMTPEQMARCYVRLKHAIDGEFVVVEADEHHIVLTNTRCPFGDAARMAPSLCRMTSSVFGGIAARNHGEPVSVLLEERIAVGDPTCRVVIAFDDSVDLDHDAAHRYAPPDDASDVRGDAAPGPVRANGH